MHDRRSQWSDLILFASFLLGGIIRFAPTILAGSVINDGGMFYVMIQNIKANHFLLPVFTSYNHLNIPYAYPPLGFYVGGFLSALGISMIEILRWIPPLVSTLSILAFYWMASLMLDSKTKASLAVMAYALMPRSFDWYVMGGGLSRTFGVFFLLLACASAWALFTQCSTKYIFLTALFGVGAVLSHPETGLHAAASCALIWLFKGRSTRGLRDAFFVALGVFVLASLWWGTVLAQHGFAPFQSALNTGAHSLLFWTPWITFDFAEERFVTLFTVLGLIGLVVQILRRDCFLPVWLFVVFIVEPRSAPAIAIFSLALLAGIALSDFVIPGVVSVVDKTNAASVLDWTVHMEDSRVIRVIVGYALLSGLIGAFVYDLSLVNYIVPSQSQIAMQWIKDNTPMNSRFVVLTGRADPFSDPSTEWFPAYTDRMSVNTIQGQEWLLGPKFTPFLDSLDVLQRCVNENISCVQTWASQFQVSFDHVFIEKNELVSSLLLSELKNDSNYSLVFENSGVAIFARK